MMYFLFIIKVFFYLTNVFEYFVLLNMENTDKLFFYERILIKYN